ncbi:MAG: hypothetical protein ACYTHM_20235 [Planctomycetota bacterium]|jgi:hypothetical protein
MTESMKHLHESYEDIIRECFMDISFEEAIIIMGIFFESRTHFSRLFKDIVFKAEEWEPKHLPPLTIEESSAIVSGSSNFGINQLKEGFRLRWSNLKHSDRHIEITKKIESHKFIGFVEELNEI